MNDARLKPVRLALNRQHIFKHLEFVGFLSALEASEDGFSQLGRHDVAQILPNEFGGRDEQIARFFGVAIQIRAITGLKEDHVRQSAQDVEVVLFTLAQRLLGSLAYGDVDSDATHADDCTRRVQDRRYVRLGPEHPPICRPPPELNDPILSACENRLALARQCFAVFLVNY